MQDPADVYTGSGNCLVPSGSKPLPEPMCSKFHDVTQNIRQDTVYFESHKLQTDTISLWAIGRLNEKWTMGVYGIYRWKWDEETNIRRIQRDSWSTTNR